APSAERADAQQASLSTFAKKRTSKLSAMGRHLLPAKAAGRVACINRLTASRYDLARHNFRSKLRLDGMKWLVLRSPFNGRSLIKVLLASAFRGQRLSWAPPMT
ncbi:MAG: hypothetical protein V3V97_14855, partial [Hyphomicrobiaceae bacterium]